MGSKGFLMRMLPFVATFTLGIFIASFFVSIAVPRFGNRAPGMKYHKMKKLRIENERLRNENLRLRNELESFNSSWPTAHHGQNPELNGEFYVQVPPVPLAPAAPRAAR